MDPKTLSASAALVLEACEARYRAEYIEKAPALDGDAAALGSCCHEVLEWWIVTGHHTACTDFSAMETFYKICYYQYFSDDNRLAEGLKMLKSWYDRQDWEGRTVLSAEVKETFDLTYTYDEQKCVIPFTYIWDRCDSLQDGDVIEVTDYKTVALPINPDDLKKRIQPRAYALAAQIKYPNAKKIWVTYDLLRYEPVGTVFSRDDNIATWRYLQELAAKARHSDGTKERLNPECRWCVRKGVCETLQNHAKVGGVLGIPDIETAVRLRANTDSAIGALKNHMAQLDDFILDYMQEHETTEVKTPTAIAVATMRATRKVDPERVVPLIPDAILKKYAKIGVTELDKILKEEDLTDQQKSAIRGMIRKDPGAPYIKTQPVTPLSEEA